MKKAQTNLDFATSISVFIVVLGFYFYYVSGQIAASTVKLDELKGESECALAATALMNKLVLNNMSLNENYFNSAIKGCIVSPPPNSPDWDAYQAFLQSINLTKRSAYLRMDLLLTTSYLMKVTEEYTEGTLYFNHKTYPVVCNVTANSIMINNTGPYKVGANVTLDSVKFTVHWIDPSCQYAVLKNVRPFHQCGALPSIALSGRGIGGGRQVKYVFFAVKDGQLLRVTFLCM